METCQPPWAALPSLPLLSDSATVALHEKEKLAMLERRYHSLTGGRPFPKTTSTLKEVMWLDQPQPEAQVLSWEALEQHVAPSPHWLRSSMGTFS